MTNTLKQEDRKGREKLFGWSLGIVIWLIVAAWFIGGLLAGCQSTDSLLPPPMPIEDRPYARPADLPDQANVSREDAKTRSIEFFPATGEVTHDSEPAGNGRMSRAYNQGAAPSSCLAPNRLNRSIGCIQFFHTATPVEGQRDRGRLAAPVSFDCGIRIADCGMISGEGAGVDHTDRWKRSLNKRTTPHVLAMNKGVACGVAGRASRQLERGQA